MALVHRLGAHSGVCREHKFGPEPPRPLLPQNLPIRCPGLGPPSGLRFPCSPSDKGLPAYLLMASCCTLPTLSTLPRLITPSWDASVLMHVYGGMKRLCGALGDIWDSKHTADGLCLQAKDGLCLQANNQV